MTNSLDQAKPVVPPITPAADATPKGHVIEDIYVHFHYDNGQPSTPIKTNHRHPHGHRNAVAVHAATGTPVPPLTFSKPTADLQGNLVMSATDDRGGKAEIVNVHAEGKEYQLRLTDTDNRGVSHTIITDSTKRGYSVNSTDQHLEHPTGRTTEKLDLGLSLPFIPLDDHLICSYLGAPLMGPQAYIPASQTDEVTRNKIQTFATNHPELAKALGTIPKAVTMSGGQSVNFNQVISNPSNLQACPADHLETAKRYTKIRE